MTNYDKWLRNFSTLLLGIMLVIVLARHSSMEANFSNLLIGCSVMSLNWRVDDKKVGWFEFFVSLLLFCGGLLLVDFTKINDWTGVTLVGLAISVGIIQCYLFSKRYKTLAKTI